jgi:putative transposase
MYFEENHLYHIYNQGNNRQKIFFGRENFLFFIEKIRTYIQPYSDILAWCLMPNHFHFMVYVKHTTIATAPQHTVGVTAHEARAKQVKHSTIATAPEPTVGVTTHEAGARQVTQTVASGSCRTFNDSIGIMLRSYTRAINIQQHRSGALFREATKAVCLTQPLNNIPTWYLSKGATALWINNIESQYPNICFNYILNNPVRAGLVAKPSQWEFSSYNELVGKEILISKKRIEEFELTLLPD